MRHQSFIQLLLIASLAFADNTYDQNKKANKLYNKGDYEGALKIYNDALLESPGDCKLRMNKGSALYKTKQFDQAVQAYQSADSMKDNNARADLYYNRGNALFMQGEQGLQSGNQQASESYKAALENYIKALDLQPHDKDAKWNLQLAQARIQQAKNMPQQNKQDQNKQDKNKQNQKDQQNQQQQQNQDNKNNQDKQNQDQQKKDDQQKKEDQQQNADQDKNKQDDRKKQDEQAAQAQPKQQDMKKEEAARLVRQYSDDASELNKPEKKKAIGQVRPEKDW